VKQFISFIRKEMFHIVRDPLTLTIMIILPILLLLILGFAISTEIRNTPFVVFDQSRSAASSKFIAKMDGNAYFTLVNALSSESDLETAFHRGECKLALILPADFGDNVPYREAVDIQLVVDASDPNEGSTLVSYVQLIAAQYQKELIGRASAPDLIQIETKMLYNPQMKGMYQIVPGMIGLIMMLICAYMTSISIAKEKELGTMEILLVSPLRPALIILAKAVPYLFISLTDVALSLLVAYFILGIPIAGNIALIVLLSLVYTLSALALGLLISTVAETQQEAMVLSGIGLMLPSMLLSNLIFPVESMPIPLQAFSYIVPARWYIDGLRDIMIKGLGFKAIVLDFFILLSMCFLLFFVSIKKFKNRL